MLDLGPILGENRKPTGGYLRIDPLKAAGHTALIGQSGSGKSFFLGRLIEEIVLKTRAKVVILDPNADFVRISKVNEALWTSDDPPYPLLRNLFLTDSVTDTKDGFTAAWNAARIVVMSNRDLEEEPSRIRVNWGSLSVSEMLSALSINERTDSDLYWYLVCTRTMCDELVREGYDFHKFREVALQIMRSLLEQEGGLANFEEHEVNRFLKSTISRAGAMRFISLLDALADYATWWSPDEVQLEYEDVGDYLARELFGNTSSLRLAEIDLLSLRRDDERLMTVNRVLYTLWEIAREKHADAIFDPALASERVPVFIVIDEAHNLAPARSANDEVKLVSDQLIRIAAEGRKFGLFLIAATQRPNKLHPSILSECSNLLLMRIADPQSLSSVQWLPASDDGLLRSLSRLDKGNVLLLGNLVDQPTLVKTGPRRSLGGGGNLTDSWTRP